VPKCTGWGDREVASPQPSRARTECAGVIRLFNLVTGERRKGDRIGVLAAENLVDGVDLWVRRGSVPSSKKGEKGLTRF
jgi:hypothetical protein